MRRTREECRKLVIEYIKSNPTVTVDILEREIGVNISKLFGGIKNAFLEASIPYNRVLSNSAFNKTVLQDIIRDFKRSPLLTLEELQTKYKFGFYKHFKSFKGFCRKYNLLFISRHDKRTIKIQSKVIDYIKSHSDATQWEINRDCHTHVQKTFKGGIIEAYKKANVSYPFNRRKIYGCSDSRIRQRAIKFENTIFRKLEKLGRLERYVKTRNGIVDAVLETDRKFIVEIKNYLAKPISNHEVRQLLNYMKALECKNGIIISSKKNNRNQYNIDGYNILVLTRNELEGAVR